MRRSPSDLCDDEPKQCSGDKADQHVEQELVHVTNFLLCCPILQAGTDQGTSPGQHHWLRRQRRRGGTRNQDSAPDYVYCTAPTRRG